MPENCSECQAQKTAVFPSLFSVMANSDVTKGIAIGMMCSKSAYRVGKDLNISRTLILRWWRRWQEEKNLDRRKGSGRPSKTERAEDRALVIKAKRKRFESVPPLFVSWLSAADVSTRNKY